MNVSGSDVVGGLVGMNEDGTILNSFYVGSVTGSTAGGLVGYNAGTITGSFTSGLVSGEISLADLLDLIPLEI